jgi:hypothetical protein
MGVRSLQLPLIPWRMRAFTFLLKDIPRDVTLMSLGKPMFPYDHLKLETGGFLQRCAFVLVIHRPSWDWKTAMDGYITYPELESVPNTLCGQRKEVNRSVWKQSHYVSRSSLEVEIISMTWWTLLIHPRLYRRRDGVRRHQLRLSIVPTLKMPCALANVYYSQRKKVNRLLGKHTHFASS